MKRLSPAQITALKWLIWLAAGLPLLWLPLAASQGWLSADPAKDIQHMTGLMALKLLLATLLVSPLARLTRQSLLMRTRRLLGIWCFVWASLHLLSYLLLELGGNVALLGSELLRRPYLTLGLVAWLILLALTLTSTRRAMSALGPRWQKLHNLVYLAAIIAPLHYLWSVKTLSPLPFFYALGALILLALRYQKIRQWWR
ncbi:MULTISPECIES: protein-methionine-sulfoxide reductase heme-binding subunit MsrQ [Edwardsiella]|uniref:Protein-methionine-sulfoxide reductase heme-binding subunit MsrQ n=2 Tax=Edwardsiella anguillarum TaxID=1821960 RepID=A0A076LQ95_9GAMM|nr:MULTISPECIES: protein-methionine-sulfoxide reductase heme-binding subunit MsrQ [Edwardsiella]AKM46762.1 sulfite oxidase subunit YedZ [Edwardsiella sp. EA181011]GAJ68534.1 sulfoxide reductase heme-binding subunit YedZ [Edwardsiella piscicida]AIJ07789.1 ferric reductase domain protein transmembrane component domain protein [Edwardsiella anguillarum ET080813]KAB0590167.1 protein-methionine-sulfoxide reductase heme-binding subunit MsrQ [Edwardsiella anguillarum]UBU94753.1 protein-methionine-sul